VPPVRAALPPATPRSFAEAVPSGAAFERGLESLTEPAADVPVEPPVPSFPPPAMASVPVPPPQAVTSAGLARRVPKLHAPAEATPAATDPSPAVGATRRSPDEVMGMLSNFRSGLARGRGEAGEDER
jgi:hypothetical protein